MQPNVENKKKPKTTVRHKILTAIGIVASIIFIPLIILNLTLIIMSFTSSAEKMPSVGGYFPLMVKSGSMSNTIEVGDLIFCKSVEDKTVLKEKDIIAFWENEPGKTLVTHRITGVTKDEDKKLAFNTKGDANIVADKHPIKAQNVVGIYVSRIPHLGDVVFFMQSPLGMMLCIVLPVLLLIAYDVIRRKLYQKTEEQEKDDLLAELEQLKQAKATETPVEEVADANEVVENADEATEQTSEQDSEE